MMLVLEAAVAVETCDPSMRGAEIARVEGQARDALRVATEAVDNVAQNRLSDDGSDVHWANYKRLRGEAARLRSLVCPGAEVSATKPPVLTARRPDQGGATNPIANAPAPVAAARRFRIEVAGSTEDRRPTSISRFNVWSLPDTLSLDGPSYFAPLALPPPAFAVPDYTSLSNPPTNTTDVRSWSSGLGIEITFAPIGLDRDGWRVTAGLAGLKSTTKTDSEAIVKSQFAGDPVITNVCRLSFCHYNYSRPTITNRVDLPIGLSVQGQVSDNVDQTSSEVSLRLGLGREKALSVLSRDLRARFGVEVVGGWWSVQEFEQLRYRSWPVGPYGVYSIQATDYLRKIDGPTTSMLLTGGLGGPLWRSFRWSVDGAAGMKVSDLSMSSRAGVPLHPGVEMSPAYHARNGEFVGDIAGRVEFVQGQWNAFLSLEGHRDVSIVSTISGRGVLSEAAAVFPDGTAVAVEPVFSTRLRLGLGYSF